MNLENIMMILYPAKCPICDELLDFRPGGRPEMVHPSCMDRLKLIHQPLCRKCGKELADARQDLCYDCSRYRRSYESGRSLWRYDQLTSEAIFAYKYGRRQDYAIFFGKAMTELLGDWIRGLEVDMILPVPVSRERKKQRGFDQAELIAREVGRRLGLPVGRGILLRVKPTAPQKELSRTLRMKNLRQAFAADAAKISQQHIRRVLLIDDIYTTGSTIECCCEVLKGAGVEKVWFATLCTGNVF